MQKFRRRLVQVEAIQFINENIWDLYLEEGIQLRMYDGQTQIWVEGMMTWVPIELGDWIINDRGEFSPCKDSVFQETYESVT